MNKNRENQIKNCLKKKENKKLKLSLHRSNEKGSLLLKVCISADMSLKRLPF